MNLTIKSKNLELTPSLQEYIEKKFQLLEKFVKDEAMLLVELEKETNHHRKGDIFWVKAQVASPGMDLMAKAHGDDALNVIVEAKEQMEMELRKHKDKTVDVPRRKAQQEQESELI